MLTSLLLFGFKSHRCLQMSRTAALESSTSESQKAPNPVPRSGPGPAPVPAAGLLPPSAATGAAPERSDASSGKAPAVASDGASSTLPAGAWSRASVTAASGAPDRPALKAPSRVPARGPDGHTDNSEAPDATNSHRVPLSGMEKASTGHHPKGAPARDPGTSFCKGRMVEGTHPV